ncbi:MAG: SGNH/GDSL hydrolase family protein [Planctomycetota bacterium]
MAAPGHGALRRRAARVLLAVAGLVLSLFVCEAALWLADLAPPDPYGYVGQHQDRESRSFVADPDLGWRMRPGAEFAWRLDGVDTRYRADANGFRVGEVPIAIGVDAPAHRLVLVGDSQTWGFGVPFEDTFGCVLARGLPDTAAVNLGMPGYGIDQVWQCLRRHALSPRPAAVVVGIVRDDFHRSLRAYRASEGFNKPVFALDGGALRRLGPADRPAALTQWLSEHSRLWTAWGRASWHLGYRYGVGGWWSLNRALLDAMVADARAQAPPVRLVFVHLPERGEGEFAPLAAWAAATGVEYVEPLRTERHGDAPCYFSDGHLTAAGHRWIAAAIRAHLQATRWP